MYQVGTFLRRKDSPNRIWVVLDVSQNRFDTTTVNVEKPGLYAFGGMWYGYDIMSVDSYGKVLPLDPYEFYEIPENEVTLKGLKS